MALAVVAVVAFSGIVRAAEIEIGTAAPDFTAKGVDGKDVTLKGSLKDAKGVVVCFTCNNCPVAVEYEDRFIDFAKKYNGKGIKFLAINVNTSEDLEKMKVRAEEKGFNFPYAYEATGDAARAYGARVTPHIFLVDASGKIAYRGAFDDNNKEPTKHFLADAADAVIAGKAPATTTSEARGCGIKPKAKE
jgi:peroxiredoxin